jgi:hypothetical protein
VIGAALAAGRRHHGWGRRRQRSAGTVQRTIHLGLVHARRIPDEVATVGIDGTDTRLARLGIAARASDVRIARTAARTAGRRSRDRCRRAPTLLGAVHDRVGLGAELIPADRAALLVRSTYAVAAGDVVAGGSGMRRAAGTSRGRSRRLRRALRRTKDSQCQTNDGGDKRRADHFTQERIPRPFLRPAVKHRRDAH